MLYSGNLYAHQIKDEQILYHLITNNEEYDFFFKISQALIDPKLGIRYFVTLKPASKRSVDTNESWQSFKELTPIFKTWIDNIKGYENSNLFDDPILKSYQAEFEKKFEIVDEDADFAPFNLEQQIYLDSYLENVKKQISSFKEGKSEEEQKEFDEIEKEATQVQKELTKGNKRKIIQKISKILAKARKISLDVFNKVAIDYLSEVTVKLLTRGL